MRLDGKVAIITGAAQGIGRAYALRFGQEGARVVVADVQDGKASDVARELGDAGSEEVAVAVDVSERHSVQAMVDTYLGRYGAVDVLVNNAALCSDVEQKPFEAITLQEWDRRPVETDPSASATVPQEIRQLIESQAIPRSQTPEDLVGVAVFLASDDSRFVTGQVINVDGGLNFGS